MYSSVHDWLSLTLEHHDAMPSSLALHMHCTAYCRKQKMTEEVGMRYPCEMGVLVCHLGHMPLPRLDSSVQLPTLCLLLRSPMFGQRSP